MSHQSNGSSWAARLAARLRRALIAALNLVIVAAWSTTAFAACPTCSSSPCTITGTHTIGSGVTCNYAGKDVILAGTLQGDGNADCYTVVADSLTVRGTLRARGSCILVDVSGAFAMQVASGSAATVDVRDADYFADGLRVTCGSAALNGNAINADADGSNAGGGYSAGWINIDCTGDVTGTGGPFHARGIGTDRGGDIYISSLDGSISLASAFDAGSINDIAGTITLDAYEDVTVGSASRTLQAQAGPESYGGDVFVTAGGTAAINGDINVNGNGEPSDGGTINVEASVVTTGTTWNARGDGGGAGGSIDVRAFTSPGTVTTTTGNASWNINSSFEAFGGSVYVGAIGDVSLAGDIDAGAIGAEGWGGDIAIETDADITVASTSRIESDSTGTEAVDGSVTLSGCNITVAGDIDTRNIDWGHNDFVYAGTFTQNGGSSLLADAGGFSGGNNFLCRCVDVSPADDTCDTPLACANPPTLNGTVTPAATFQPLSRDTCS